MRAKMKRFNPEGRSEPNRSKFRSAEKRLRKLGKAVTEFEQKNAHLLLNQVCSHSGLCFPSPRHLVILQECVAALVVFNNEDSRSYCLEDYKGSTTSWGLRWQVLCVASFAERCVPSQPRPFCVL